MTESNQGFFVVAQNSLDCDYIKQAYYLAKSIARSQSTVKNISLMTNDTVPAEYVPAFDKIIKIPFEDHALNSEWKVQNRWKAYHATPYEQTILLDADMLITYNWEKFYGEFSPKNYQKFYSLDVTISIAAKILGLENCFDNNQICSFTHMKSLIQGWHTVHPDWTKVAQVEIIDADTIYINQFKQSGVLHYVEDSFLEDYINYVS